MSYYSRDFSLLWNWTPFLMTFPQISTTTTSRIPNPPARKPERFTPKDPKAIIVSKRSANDRSNGAEQDRRDLNTTLQELFPSTRLFHDPRAYRLFLDIEVPPPVSSSSFVYRSASDSMALSSSEPVATHALRVSSLPSSVNLKVTGPSTESVNAANCASAPAPGPLVALSRVK